jgi:DMSO/TMAO reductase YedYZ molybdopterin-dependent catalytic subunit
MGLFRRSAEGDGPGSQDRVPPGQTVTPKMAVMTLGQTPRVEKEQWGLRLFGAVEAPVSLTWDDLQALPRVSLSADFHCVTQWSRLDVGWGGVLARTVLERVRPVPEARWVMLHGADGYTTNVDLDVLGEPDSLFADTLDGAPLPTPYGGPVRVVVSSRYGWKSAKWVTGVEFMTADSPGFWERNGYHMRGEPWAEERFGRI